MWSDLLVQNHSPVQPAPALTEVLGRQHYLDMRLDAFSAANISETSCAEKYERAGWANPTSLEATTAQKAGLGEMMVLRAEISMLVRRTADAGQSLTLFKFSAKAQRPNVYVLVIHSLIGDLPYMAQKEVIYAMDSNVVRVLVTMATTAVGLCFSHRVRRFQRCLANANVRQA
jgi:hypothetical protein